MVTRRIEGTRRYRLGHWGGLAGIGTPKILPNSGVQNSPGERRLSRNDVGFEKGSQGFEWREKRHDQRLDSGGFGGNPAGRWSRLLLFLFGTRPGGTVDATDPVSNEPL